MRSKSKKFLHDTTTGLIVQVEEVPQNRGKSWRITEKEVEPLTPKDTGPLKAFDVSKVPDVVDVLNYYYGKDTRYKIKNATY